MKLIVLNKLAKLRQQYREQAKIAAYRYNAYDETKYRAKIEAISKAILLIQMDLEDGGPDID